MWLINNMPIIERKLNECGQTTLMSVLLPLLACFMASDAAAAFNGAGALILHLLQPFYRSDKPTERKRERASAQVRSVVLFCALWNFLHNFHIKKHGQNCYDYIS